MPKKTYLASFEEAREFARSLNLKGIAEWKEWAKSGKRPQNIPMTPHWVYKNKGWKDWGDFLGNGNIAKFKMEFLSFEKARDFAHSLNLKGVEEWYTFAKSGKRPQNIPANPYIAYNGKGWTNWKDFLGVSDVSTRFLSFEEVRNFAYSLKLKSQKEWQEWAKSEKRPHNIPCNPYQSYKDKGWTNWKDFLGTTISKVVELEECLELH
jgi:hypothetical protein